MHLNDIDLFKRCSWKVVCWCLAWTSSIAPMSAATTGSIDVRNNEVFQEGLRLRPVSACDMACSTRSCGTSLRTIAASPRQRGDITACIAALDKAETRLTRLAERDGWVRDGGTGDLRDWDLTEQLARQVLARIPRGDIASTNTSRMTMPYLPVRITARRSRGDGPWCLDSTDPIRRSERRRICPRIDAASSVPVHALTKLVVTKSERHPSTPASSAASILCCREASWRTRAPGRVRYAFHDRDAYRRSCPGRSYGPLRVWRGRRIGCGVSRLYFHLGARGDRACGVANPVSGGPGAMRDRTVFRLRAIRGHSCATCRWRSAFEAPVPGRRSRVAARLEGRRSIPRWVRGRTRSADPSSERSSRHARQGSATASARGALRAAKQPRPVAIAASAPVSRRRTSASRPSTVLP